MPKTMKKTKTKYGVKTTSKKGTKSSKRGY